MTRLLLALPLFLILASGWLTANETRFSAGCLLLGRNVGSVHEGGRKLVHELTIRSQIDPLPGKGWQLVDQSLKKAPPLLWILVGPKVTINRALNERLQRYIASGGTVFVETDGSAAAGEVLRELRTGVFGQKESIAMKKDDLITRTFYVLPASVSKKFSSIKRSGRVVWIETQFPLLQRLTSDEQSVRTAVNIVVYTLTGSYKDDLTHLRYLMRRRKK